MNPEDVPALVHARIEQAKECLDDAAFLLSADRGTRNAINRGYYACFYAVLAVL